MTEQRTGEQIAAQNNAEWDARHEQRRERFFRILSRRTGRPYEELIETANQARDEYRANRSNA